MSNSYIFKSYNDAKLAYPALKHLCKRAVTTSANKDGKDDFTVINWSVMIHHDPHTGII